MSTFSSCMVPLESSAIPLMRPSACESCANNKVVDLQTQQSMYSGVASATSGSRYGPLTHTLLGLLALKAPAVLPSLHSGDLYHALSSKS